MRGKKTVKNVKELERNNAMQGKKTKVSKFQLMSDDDEENDADILRMTHRGKNLEKLDDFKDEIDQYSDHEDNQNQEKLDQMNFQGFTKEDVLKLGIGNHKSKKDIYEEIIKKSKFMKHEKQRQRDNDMEKLEELDKNWQDVADLLTFRGAKSKQEDRKKQKQEDIINEDDYDKLAREMEYADRNQATFEPKLEKQPKNSEKNDSNKKTKSKKEAQSLAGVLSDDEVEDEIVNDDELDAGKVRREKKIMKHYRSVEKLNSYMDKIKSVKAKRLQSEKNEIEYGEDYEAELEGEYSEEESDEDDLADIDLDDVENQQGEQEFDDEEEEDDFEEDDEEDDDEDLSEQE